MADTALSVSFISTKRIQWQILTQMPELLKHPTNYVDIGNLLGDDVAQKLDIRL